MTINFLTDALLAGRRDDTDLTNYPYATFKDRTSTLSNNGTPLTYAKTWKDFDGFRQKILGAGKVTPNGDTDTAIDSQIFEALMHQYGGSMYFYDASATSITWPNLDHSYIGPGSIVHVEESGSDYHIYTALKDGGIQYGGIPGGQVGDGTVTTRTAEFSIDPDTVIMETGEVVIDVNAFIELTGIPYNSKVHSVSLYAVQPTKASGPYCISTNLSCQLTEQNGFKYFSTGRGNFNYDNNDTPVYAYLFVTFDPSSVY